LLWIEYSEMAGLFFLQAMANAMWFVPFSVVLDTYGLHAVKPYAFATLAVAAFVSPLVFGAMADRHAPPVAVLRGLSAATAVTLVATFFGIQRHWNPWLIVALVQLQALCSTPTTSISTAIVFARLRRSRQEFGAVRAAGTFGWICGCWVISALSQDASARSGFSAAALWLGLAGFTWLLPAIPPPPGAGRLTLRQRMGWDALALLRNHDHRVVFVTAALFSIPFAAFYPFTPPQLIELGLDHPSAWMTLGQMSELIAMFSLAGVLARWRLKWILAAGMGFALLRYGLYSLNSKAWVLAGVSLHGFALTLFFITAQIYVNDRVDPAWRVRAQALLYLMMNGVGNLLGYLGAGWWFNACAASSGIEHWPLFWDGLALAIALVLVYFLSTYHGKGHRRESRESSRME
jgi:MFS family permease